MSGKTNVFSSSDFSDFDYGQHSYLKLETSSELDLEVFVLEWKLNVSQGVLKSETLTSPIFIGGVRSQHSWQLKLLPSIFKHKLTVHVNLLKIENKEFSENGEEVRAKAIIDIQKPQVESRFEIQKELQDLQLSKFQPGKLYFSTDLDTDELFPLFGNDRKNHFYNKNVETLTVYCILIIKCGMKHSAIIKTPCFESAQNETTVIGSTNYFSKTLKTLYNSHDFSDIVVSTKKERIPAHKAILAAQSPVFKAMFQTRMLETRRNVVKIKEFSSVVVKAMLEFIYTGEASDLTDPGKVVDLFRISDKYGLLELKNACEQKLCFKLNAENATEFFHLATLYNAKTLKVFALRFIHENKLKVCETEFFKKLVETDPNLLLELYLSI